MGRERERPKAKEEEQETKRGRDRDRDRGGEREKKKRGTLERKVGGKQASLTGDTRRIGSANATAVCIVSRATHLWYPHTNELKVLDPSLSITQENLFQLCSSNSTVN